jgi:hypothetical protein
MTVHEEVTAWPLWAALITWGAGLLGTVALWAPVLGGTGGPAGALKALLGAGVALSIPLAVQLLFGRLRVRVTRSSLHLAFGYTPFITRVIEFHDITGMEAVRYRPLREFGGWGIRYAFRGRKRGWTMRGNRALVLALTDETRFYVGSGDPERLAARIRLVADIPEIPLEGA